MVSMTPRVEYPARPATVIEPHRGWRGLDLRELAEYRDLLYFLTWRDIKVRYKQTVLGAAWAIIQPVATMVIFTIIFGGLAQIPSDGVPYPVFSFAALVPWTYFSSALNRSSTSLVGQANLLSKVYFPRLTMPLSAVLAHLVDFGIALVLLFGLMAYFGMAPTPWALALPLLVALMIASAFGLGCILTALAVRYRDVKHGMSLLMAILMYASPVIYPVSMIPAAYRGLYALNPMVGVIEGFRAALLGTTPMPWDFLAIGATTAAIMTVAGVLYFRRLEGTFADVA